MTNYLCPRCYCIFRPWVEPMTVKCPDCGSLPIQPTTLTEYQLHKINELKIEIVKCNTQLGFFQDIAENSLLYYKGRAISEKAITIRLNTLNTHIKNIIDGTWED